MRLSVKRFLWRTADYSSESNATATGAHRGAKRGCRNAQLAGSVHLSHAAHQHQARRVLLCAGAQAHDLGKCVELIVVDCSPR